MKKLILTIIFTITIITVSTAQDYKTGIGLRAGYPAGLTVKHFISNKTALEGIFATRWRGFIITGLFESSKQLADVDNLNWYWGLGAHIGFWNNGNYSYWGESGTSYTVIGLDGILGIEYNFEDIPINLSLDWKPAFNISGYTGFWGDGGAFSIRYIF
ncbi:MAG TPA: hypothetical protein VHO46_00270 [Bacteroidales bacterium]|nr:hypothetical protein [Bacteroidales bacterium]